MGGILFTGQIRRLTIPAAYAAGLRVVTGTGMRGFLGCNGFGPSQLGPYG